MTEAFEKSKAAAEPVEWRIAEIFLRAGWWAQRRFSGPRKDIAVMSPTGMAGLEIKDESSYPDPNGNICVELFQNGREGKRWSGLFKSESTFTVHVFGDDCIIYRTRGMMVYVFQETWDCRNGEKRGLEIKAFRGSDNGNQGVIIPKQTVLAQEWAEGCRLIQLPNCRLLKQI